MSRRLKLSVQYACERAGLPLRADLLRWATAALSGMGEVTIRFVDLAEGQTLNHSYRGKDTATNVLSFAYEQEPKVIGDLVLCAPVIRDEAAAQDKPLAAHYAHLVVHGMLHLQGMDHLDEAQATTMEALETGILAGLGYPDPYQEN